MAFDLSGMSSILFGWVGSGVFWLGLIIVLAILAFIFYLYMNRRSKLKYNCLELIRFGNGKVGINLHQCGLFKTRTILNGLIDYGTEFAYKLIDGRVIQGAKTSYLHDILGRKGFIVVRKAGDAKILVPIDKIQFENLQALFRIAPGDFRDASVKIVEGATKETQGWADKYLPYLLIGALIIGIIISQVVSMQLINRAQDKALEIQQASCSNSANTAPAPKTTP